MKHDNTRTLFQYWNDLRAGRAAPYRREVDPRAIESLLDSTFILEHLDDRSSRFRLAGTRLCEHFGMELRGMSALALWQGDCRERAREMLNHVVKDPCIGHLTCTVETREGYLYEAEFLYLPLRNDFGDMSRILGCGYYMGGFSTASRPGEPIQHWIDDVRLYAIEASVHADEPPFRAVDAIEKPRLRETISMLENQLRDRTVMRSQLRSIDGGRRGGLPLSATPSALAETPRDHLRIVK